MIVPMTSINLLPEDLRKREKLFNRKEPKQSGVDFVHQTQVTTPSPLSPQSKTNYGASQSVPAQSSAPPVSTQLVPPVSQTINEKRGSLKKPEQEFNSGSLQKNIKAPAHSSIKKESADTQKPKKLTPKTESKKIDFKRFFNRETIKRLFAKKKKVEVVDEHVDVNLLREEISLQRSLKPEIIKLLALTGLLLVLTYLVGFYFQSRQGALQDELAKLEEQLTNLNAQQAAIIAQGEKLKQRNDYIDAVYALVKSRVNWSLFLEAVEKRTFNTVYYSSLSAGDLGNVVVSAKAQTITDALAQVKFFEKDTDFAKDVKLVSLSPRQVEEAIPGEEKQTRILSFVDFSFSFAVNPEWLEKSTVGIAL